MAEKTTLSFAHAPAEAQAPAVDVQRTALLLDIDGTLLDIAGRPEEVRVPGALPLNLASLSECMGGALALVSGRRIAAIDALFAPMKFPAIGCHGAELRPSAAWGTAITQAAPLDSALRDRLVALAGRFPAIEIEDKTYTLALHYRGSPEIEDALLDAVAEICADAPPGTVRLLRGKCVIETKTAGFDKGTGVRALMTYAPFRGRQPIFVGDDVTDEDAFAALRVFHGMAVAVGRPIDGTAFVFENPRAVRAWLAKLNDRECR